MNEPRFGTAFRRDPAAPADLGARIDIELRERLEEAIEFACLDVMVQRRRALGLPAPAAHSARDREEFVQSVRAFLVHLRQASATGLTPQQTRAIQAAANAAPDETTGLLAVQVVLAKELPDYWQRFETTRVAYTAERVASGGERRRLRGRFFGRG